MDDSNLTLWPLYFACALLIFAAIVNMQSLTVPNRLSLPAILAGWLVAFSISAFAIIPSRGGGILPSVIATAIGFLLLVPFYKSGWLGAGCVKMQMAFGAWIGCAIGLPAAALVTAFATVAGILFTAIGAGYTILRLRSRDGVGVGTHLFPAQVTLSLGSVCGVFAAGLMEWI